MSDRNTTHEVLAIRARESPSGDMISTFLSRDSGLFDVFVFGGHKSSLRAYAAPYSHGTAFVYTDPVKNYKKLTDMVVEEPFHGLRDSYARAWAASALSEFLIRTSACGGEFGRVIDLSLASLRIIDSSEDANARLCALAALWKFIVIMGLKPDTDRCAACGSALFKGPKVDFAQKPENLHSADYGPSVYLARSGEGFICQSCAKNSESRNPTSLAISGKILAWFESLSVSEAIDPKSFLEIETEEFHSASRFVFLLSSIAAEGPLLSFDFMI